MLRCRAIASVLNKESKVFRFFVKGNVFLGIDESKIYLRVHFLHLLLPVR
jgi:hypothetical protein